MRHVVVRTAFFVTALALASAAFAQTAPPAPALVDPSAGAGLVEPLTLRWGAVVDPDGPIGSYTWQVSTSSTFATTVAAGFTQESLPGVPVPTQSRVSGLPIGTYFWRVKASQTVGGAVGSIESPWSAVRSFMVVGIGAAPGTPSFTSPTTGTRFHAREFFDVTWSAVADAQYYLLEADDEPTFSDPLTLTTDPIQFGTKFRAGWGNEIPNVYYRIRAVSADGVRGLPSSTLNVKITNTAPVPPAPTLLSPIGGAALSIPLTFDWTDTPNQETPSYDLDIDDEPAFQGVFGVFLIQNLARSDYMIVDTLPPGTYFWRVRAVHGAVPGPWSAGASFTVVAAPPTPPGLALANIVAGPVTTYGGNPTQARVTLNMPAPAGGAVIKVASDLAEAQTPASVFIPAGATDATVPITTVAVGGEIVGTIRAAYAGGWQMSSLGVSPILWGISLNAETAIGGSLLTGTVTLLNPAPPGGLQVTLVSSDTSLVTPPARVFIPAGATGATFDVATSPLSVPTIVRIDLGDALENYRAPNTVVTLMPAGSAPAAASVATLSLSANRVAGGASIFGTVTLTAPAPAGGALVRLSGSMEGQVVVPPNVTVPAGAMTADFTINAPQVIAPFWVLIQATYSPLFMSHARLLEIDPGASVPTLLGFAVSPTGVIGGDSMTGTVTLVSPAPAGGAQVILSTDIPSVVHVPASVSIPAGNSSGSFTVTTSSVASFTTGTINASAGGVTKTEFISLGAGATAPALQSLTLGATSVTGGTSVAGTVTLTAAAPSGGVSVTLSTNNPSAAQATPSVTVPAGQTQTSFTVTTFTVSANTSVAITGFQGSVTRSANLTVLAGATQPPAPGTPTLVSPANGAASAQPVTLDWSDATNAVSYEIQVDDSSGFTAPLVRSLTSTASQTSVTGLSSVTHWWRVRAKNSAGVVGNWSAARTFTPTGGAPAATTIALSGLPATIARGQSFTATATVTNTGTSAASGLSVVISFSPSDAVRLNSPQSATQSVATVAAGGSQNVSWQLRADRAGSTTVTMALKNASGTTVGTVSRMLTITN